MTPAAPGHPGRGPRASAASRTLRLALGPGLLVLLVSACGQMGPLTLPGAVDVTDELARESGAPAASGPAGNAGRGPAATAPAAGSSDPDDAADER